MSANDKYKKKRTPEEAWKALEKIAVQDEAERVAELSDAELDAELRAEGFDPPRVRARGAAIADELMRRGARTRQKVNPPRRRRTSWTVALVAAALAAAGIAGAAILSLPHRRAPTTEDRAAQLRREAAEACAEALWGRCEDKLDEARALDPAGDSDPVVGALRRLAQERMWPDASPEGKKK